MPAYDGGWWKSFRRKLAAPFRGFRHQTNFNYAHARGKRIFDIAHKYAPASKSPCMLDIGCNKGYLLSNAVAAGYEVYGIEIVPVLMLPFQRRYPEFATHIMGGDFSHQQSKFEDAKFDLITAIDVIEHFQQLEEDMQNVYRILKPGGTFVIQTPNTNSEKAKADGADWGAIKALEHLQLFNPQNLNEFAQKIGFSAFKQIPPFDEGIGNMSCVIRK